MKFNPQFSDRIKDNFSRNSGDKHPSFVDERPMSVSEMYRRVINNIPLSIPKPPSDRINVNGKFYTDAFDVLDTALANETRISEENKQKALLEQRKIDDERKAFNEWKESLKTSKPSSRGGTIENGATIDDERKVFNEWKESLKTSKPSSQANGAAEGTIST